MGETVVHKTHQSLHTHLAKALPQSTHWYTQFLVSQCAVYCMDLTRYINLVKFLALRTVYDTEMARSLCEPEDQDYYGLGSRSARWMTIMWIGIMFCQISPLISFFVFANFAVCRIVYGYLLLYAETRKPDMGGVLWVRMLQDLQICLFFYVLLMVGYFELNYGRTQSCWPSVIAVLSLIPWGRSFYKFSRLSWKSLPYEELAKANSEETEDEVQEAYIQPELVNSDDELSRTEMGEAYSLDSPELTWQFSDSESLLDD